MDQSPGELSQGVAVLVGSIAHIIIAHHPKMGHTLNSLVAWRRQQQKKCNKKKELTNSRLVGDRRLSSKVSKTCQVSIQGRHKRAPPFPPPQLRNGHANALEPQPGCIELEPIVAGSMVSLSLGWCACRLPLGPSNQRPQLFDLDPNSKKTHTSRRWFGLGWRRATMQGRGQVRQDSTLAKATAEERREPLYFDASSGHGIGDGFANGGGAGNNMDLSGSSGSSSVGNSTGSASRSPSPRTPTTAEALEWAEWLKMFQKNFTLLRRLDVDILFGEQHAQEMRLSAAATIIRIRGLVANGPLRFYPEIQELAERAGA